MSVDEMIEVVDEQDNVIGLESRETVHREGLLHREVHVWITNQKGEVLFQLRSPTKDTFPNLLDASVGGHVDPGMSYLETAIKEMQEETGIVAMPEDLVFAKKVRAHGVDTVTKGINNTWLTIFTYQLKPDQHLTIEKGEATSLEFWPLGKLQGLSEEEKQKFIPHTLRECLEVFSNNLPN